MWSRAKIVDCGCGPGLENEYKDVVHGWIGRLARRCGTWAKGLNCREFTGGGSNCGCCPGLLIKPRV